jgi:hypothetical protein
MSDSNNADLTIRILQAIQSELVGLRQDNRGIHGELGGIRGELAGLREDNHEIRDEIRGLSGRIDGVLRLAGRHHDDLERRVSTLEERVDRLS